MIGEAGKEAQFQCYLSSSEAKDKPKKIKPLVEESSPVARRIAKK